MRIWSKCRDQKDIYAIYIYIYREREREREREINIKQNRKINVEYYAGVCKYKLAKIESVKFLYQFSQAKLC